jgi:hypothetical protein
VDRPSEVGFEGKKYRQVDRPDEMGDRTWFYNAAAKNLQVRATVKAGEDCIVNVTF